ncbi:MAG: hypothetical protein ABL994_08495, partial [Verrucomicrobiales bacterium]
AVRTASRIGLAIAASVGLLFVAIPTQLLALFGMEQPDVVRIGVQLLGFLSISGLFITTALTNTGGLQGTGDNDAEKEEENSHELSIRWTFYLFIVSGVPAGFLTAARPFSFAGS